MRELQRASDAQSTRDLKGIARALAACLQSTSSLDTRRAALLATGSFILALGRERAAEFLPQLLPAILDSFKDSDVGLRLAAAESLYNITRVVRQNIAPFAASTMEALLKVASDNDSEVDRALAILHPLLQVTVNECKTVSASSLVAPLVGGLRSSVSAAVVTSIRWVLSLESSPHVGCELLHDHPEVLHLLFAHAASNSGEIAELAKEALDELLDRTVSELAAKRRPFDYPPVLQVLFAQCRSSQKVRWGIAVEWILAIARQRGDELMPEHGASIAVEVIR